MINKLKPTVVLTVICLVVALLLAVINSFTAPKIEQNLQDKANEAMLEVLPNAKSFDKLTIDGKYPSAIKEGYKADVGYVFNVTVPSYQGADLVVMVGIDNDGKITRTKKIADGDTDTRDVLVFPFVQGDDGKYNGMSLDTFSPFLAATATVTSNAYASAVKAALTAYEVAAKGAVADNRTEEQILQDSCNTALGTEDVSFTKWFATEVLTDIDAVYVSTDGTVFKINDKLIGFKDGNTVGEVTDEEKSAVIAAYSVYSTATLTEAELPDGASANVLKAYVTGNGNYVFEARGAGYDRNNEYSSTKDYIYIKIAISRDGKIIDVLTTSHNESKDYGDKCASQEFYSQIIGKDKDSSQSVSITGATITTEGYKRAVKQAFEAFELLTANTHTEGEG